MQNRGVGKQILISFLITLVGIILVVFVFGPLIFGYLIEIIPDILLRNKIFSFFIFLLSSICLIIFFIQWLKAFINSVKTKNDSVIRKGVEYKIIIHTIMTGASVCLAIVFLIVWLFTDFRFGF